MFSSRNLLLRKFESLFSPTQSTDDGGKEDEQGDGFTKHWGWFATLHYLASTPILSINGERSVLDCNIVFVFNYLAYEQDKNKRDEQIRKQTERQYRIK